MSPRRRLLRLLSFAALYGAILLLWWDRRPTPPPVAAPATAMAPAPAAPGPTARPWPDLGEWISAGVLRQTEVTIQVVEAGEQAPLSGITVALGEAAVGVSDAAGRVILRAVPHGTQRFFVEGPWIVHAGASSTPAISGARQELLLVISRACPGPLVVRDAEGRPLADVALSGLSGEGGIRARLADLPPSDAGGRLVLEARPCGAVQFELQLPGEAAPVHVGAAVAAAEEVVSLTVPDIGEALLQVVDGGGAPLEAAVRGHAALSIEALSVGRFRLTSRRSALPLVVQPGDLVERAIRVPVDGGEHVYVAEPGRAVAVRLICDTEGCPVRVSCETAPCEALSATEHQCFCPEADADLAVWATETSGAIEVETVPWGTTAVTVDLRREAAVQGRWTGALPCRASVRHRVVGAFLEVPCDPDGRFVVSEVPPGSATLTVRHGSQVGARTVTLAVGQEVDVGEIGPSSLEVDGWILADFPLIEAWLDASPGAEVTLTADGWFQVRGLPEGTAQLGLWLYSPSYGTFEQWFWLGGSTSLEWTLRREEAVDTLPIEEADDLLLLTDTGAPSPTDTGDPRSLGDTGVDAGQDSGGEDSDSGL